jgi:iron(III) transport system substrate-binding protein
MTSFLMASRGRHGVLGIATVFAGMIVAGTASAQADWQKTWNDWVAGAKKEGAVSVLVPAGESYRESVQGFSKAYPDIKLTVTAELIRDSLPRIQRERAANIHSTDVIIGAVTPVYFAWIPNGVLVDLKSVLIRPDVTDNSKWRCGYDWGWIDKAQKYTFAFTAVSPTDVYINRDAVSEADLPSQGATFDALLDPKWVNKISWQDPRVSGQGQSIAGMILMTHGADFLKQYIVKQKTVFTADLRQQADWTVRNRYPIAMGLDDTALGDLQATGVGKNVQPIHFKEILAMTPQYGVLGMFSNAPHPDAAKVFANWMLTRDAQDEYHRSIRSDSRRTDVPPFRESLLPPANACEAAIDHQREEYAHFKDEGGKVAAEAYQQIQ